MYIQEDFNHLSKLLHSFKETSQSPHIVEAVFLPMLDLDVFAHLLDILQGADGKLLNQILWKVFLESMKRSLETVLVEAYHLCEGTFNALEAPLGDLGNAVETSCLTAVKCAAM